jgi:hypothetical protein
MLPFNLYLFYTLDCFFDKRAFFCDKRTLSFDKRTSFLHQFFQNVC